MDIQKHKEPKMAARMEISIENQKKKLNLDHSTL